MPPKSAAERQRKCRAIMSDEKKEEQRERAKERMRKIRENRSTTKRKAENKKTAERMKRWRAKKRELMLNTSDTSRDTSTVSYHSTQTLGKAVKKVIRCLPKSPRKKKAVIQKLSEKFVVAENPSTSSAGGRPGHSQLVRDTIEDFYLRDDISRQFAGLKDVVSVRCPQTKKRIRKQKRLLMYNVKEVYHLFAHEFPDIKVSPSYFAALRPKEVVLASSHAHTVCCCPYCENVRFLVRATQWTCANPNTTSLLIEKVVCSIENEECMKKRCDSCKTKALDFLTDNVADVAEVRVNQWEGGNLVEKVWDRENFIFEFQRQITHMCRHKYNISTQSKCLRQQKCDLGEDEVIMLSDFAENYTTKFQNEVMAAHWNSPASSSVTIYTVVVYYKAFGETLEKSFAVISNSTKHGSLEVALFNRAILCELKKTVDIRTVHFWTDGAAQHFKNWKTMVVLTYMKDDENMQCDWNFQESYHGKGPHDGIGAICKRTVWKRVIQGRNIVRNAKDFFDIVNTLCKSTTCLYIPETVVESDRGFWESRWATARKAKGIIHARRIVPIEPYVIDMYENSGVNSTFIKTCDLSPTT